MIVSARYGVLEEILRHERSHASSTEVASTGAESSQPAEEPQPESRGPTGMPSVLRLSSPRQLHNTSADHLDTPLPSAQGKHLWHCQQPGFSALQWITSDWVTRPL